MTVVHCTFSLSPSLPKDWGSLLLDWRDRVYSGVLTGDKTKVVGGGGKDNKCREEISGMKGGKQKGGIKLGANSG